MRKLGLFGVSVALLCALGCGDDGAQTTSDAPPTYWSDMAPLFAEHCTQCHREGGIAPFRLDDYAMAKQFAEVIEHATTGRTMPPWSVTSDGSCGEFADSEALSDAQIARIAAWVRAGAPEGERRTLELREPASLDDATDLLTPVFTPEIQGGELSAYDEYRCFKLDHPSDSPTFITGYQVLPGAPEIVHHVIVIIVDPDAPARNRAAPSRSNREQLQALDDESPDRDGWPCYGSAGDGVRVEAQPVVWAPGQGVIEFPGQSGVPLSPGAMLVAQVHYNLANADNRGMVDQTRVRLRLTPNVPNAGLFVLEDPLLDTLEDDMPTTLASGQRSTVYSWTRSAEELGLDDVSQLELRGVMPHMHELGRKYRMELGDECAADVQRWDFHWQRMYFYAEPRPFGSDSRITVSCDYDTSSVSAPVRPGWGTRNEMCLAALYFTVPIDVFQQIKR